MGEPPAGPRLDPRHADAVRAAARLARVAANALGDAELTLAQYRVLVFLDDADRPATQVAGLLGVTPSTVTSVVDGLAARQLVERRAEPTARGGGVLAIAPAGRELVAAADDVVGDRLSKLLARLPDDGAERVLVGLEHLNRAMDLYVAEKFGDPT